MPTRKKVIDEKKLDAIVAKALHESAERDRGYRERALKMFPWVCGRCGRSFTRANLRELTVHHKNHNHDDNPPDGSNWELLCIYCHDNEHARLHDHVAGAAASDTPAATTGNPFSDLSELWRRRDKP